MKRILIIGRAFPHVAHGYINNDIEYLTQQADVLVLSPNQPMAPWYSPVRCNYFRNKDQLLAQARQFKPDFIISWLLPNHHWARDVADALKIPFILKLHTPDYYRLYPGNRSIKKRIKEMLASCILSDRKLSDGYRISKRSLRRTISSKYFKGAFCIPAFKTSFSKYIPANKLFDLTPRIFFDRFHDEHDNGRMILVLGSLIKRREGVSFIDDALKEISEPIDWYTIPTPGLILDDIQGVPENFSAKKYVPNKDMATLYKQYKALIVIADKTQFSRGLPLSVLEAQASGVCVIAPSLRPDFDEFVINGGGYLYNDASEIQAILNLLPNDERRNMGFKHAKKFDIKGLVEELSFAGLNL